MDWARSNKQWWLPMNLPPKISPPQLEYNRKIKFGHVARPSIEPVSCPHRSARLAPCVEATNNSIKTISSNHLNHCCQPKGNMAVATQGPGSSWLLCSSPSENNACYGLASPLYIWYISWWLRFFTLCPSNSLSHWPHVTPKTPLLVRLYWV